MVRLTDPVAGTLAPGVVVQKKRQMTLNEVQELPTTVGGVDFEGGPEEVLVNNTLWSGKDENGNVRSDFTPITVGGITTGYSELPKEGETEIWEIINTTADAHPIRLHLVQFQLINRQSFDTRKYMGAYAQAYGGTVVNGFGPPRDYNVPNADGAVGGNPAVGPFLRGPAKPPEANEAGWKDTVMMRPGQVTRIAVRWAPIYLPVRHSRRGRLLSLRPERRLPARLRLALPHHRPRGQRNDEARHRSTESRRAGPVCEAPEEGHRLLIEPSRRRGGPLARAALFFPARSQPPLRPDVAAPRTRLMSVFSRRGQGPSRAVEAFWSPKEWPLAAVDCHRRTPPAFVCAASLLTAAPERYRGKLNFY